MPSISFYGLLPSVGLSMGTGGDGAGVGGGGAAERVLLVVTAADRSTAKHNITYG